MSKKTWMIGAGIIGVLAILGGGLYWMLSEHEGDTGLPQARLAPGFSLKDAAGREHSLKDLDGKPVLVHFWAAWCPPCLEEIPQWVALAKRYEKKPLGFVAVSLDPQWADALKVLPLASTPANIISLLDFSGKLSENYGTFQFPETYLLNSKHEIVHKFVGGQDWNSPKIIQALDQLLVK